MSTATREPAAETIRIEEAAVGLTRLYARLLAKGAPVDFIVGLMQSAVSYEPRLGRPAPPRLVRGNGMTRPADIRCHPITVDPWGA